MKSLWELDDETTVEARFSALGREAIRVNGHLVVDRHSFGTQNVDFQLPDSRRATISFHHYLYVAPRIQLRVAGTLYAPTPTRPPLCRRCDACIKINDRFCGHCGIALPDADERQREIEVGEATSAMRVLAVLFAVSGMVMSLIAQIQAANALALLVGFDGHDSVTVEGVAYRIADVRAQIEWQPMALLLTNLFLALAMTLMAVWSRRAPLAAVLAASGIFASVVVLNGILDPHTLLQGLVLKVLVVAYLVKGATAALALRDRDDG